VNTSSLLALPKQRMPTMGALTAGHDLSKALDFRAKAAVAGVLIFALHAIGQDLPN
jgi:hypothetical protein